MRFNKLKKMVAMALSLCLTIPAASAFASSEKVTIAGDHGKLAGIVQRPDGKESYPMVLLLHGFTANKDSLPIKTLADSLEEKGIASLRIDFNGHGDSEGRFQDMTVPNEIVDAEKAFDYAASLPGVTSMAIAGHSQGGVVTSMAAGELGADKVKCIVLMAPAAVLREDAIRGNTQGATYDPLNPPAYVEMVGRKAGLKLGREYIKTAFNLPIYETAARYRGSACMIHGTGDRVVPYTYSERYSYIYPNSELHLLPGFDHGFTQDVKSATDIAADYLEKHFVLVKKNCNKKGYNERF